jgi:hypothetical protein
MSLHPIHRSAHRLAEARRTALYVLLIVAASPLAGAVIAISILATVRP